MNSTPDAVGDDPVGEDARGDEEGAVAESGSEQGVATDARLFEAHDVALAALQEITPAETIGDPAGYIVEAGGVVSLRFETKLLGYPGWFWTATVAAAGDAEPTVLEVEMLPGDEALLAPEWVPWAVRLEEYRKAQAVAEAERAVRQPEGTEDDDADDAEEFEEGDYDADAPLLHAGDVDGVDIDEFDEYGVPYEESDSDDDVDEDDVDAETGSDDEDANANANADSDEDSGRRDDEVTDTDGAQAESR